MASRLISENSGGVPRERRDALMVIKTKRSDLCPQQILLPVRISAAFHSSKLLFSTTIN